MPDKYSIRTVFCVTHQSVWGDEEESFDLSDEHCERYYWLMLQFERNPEELGFGGCEPINVDITER